MPARPQREQEGDRQKWNEPTARRDHRRPTSLRKVQAIPPMTITAVTATHAIEAKSLLACPEITPAPDSRARHDDTESHANRSARP